MSGALFEDAVALAGDLAAMGVQRVEVCAAGGAWRELHARVTDLPGEIVRAGEGAELRWVGGGACVEAGRISRWGDPA